jgi:hypothetical protein
VGVVRSVDDSIRERANDCAGRVMEQFGRAILPIYLSDRRFRTHVGTCTLVRIDGKQLLVTAAHVFDKRKIGQLWVGGEDSLVPLTGKFMETKAPDGERKKDHYDFAAIEVGLELARQLGDVTYIGPDSISNNRRQPEKKVLYLCVGYPNSKNKDIHATKREINAGLLNHIAPGHLKHDGVGSWAKTTADHLFIDIPKRHAKNVGGQRINAVQPTGISGGAVFYMGDFADYESYSPRSSVRPMLESIIIERYTEARVLVSVLIATIVKAARDANQFWSE